MVTFDKNVFFQNETAWATVTVDNSKSDLRVHEIEFEIRQHLTLTSNHHHVCHNTFFVLENKDHSGMEPHCHEKKTLRMGLELSRVHYDVNPNKKKKHSGGLFFLLGFTS